MKKQDQKQDQARPFGRQGARELTQAEIDAVSGSGGPFGGGGHGGNHTDATGINGDDPGDPPVYN